MSTAHTCPGCGVANYSSLQQRCPDCEAELRTRVAEQDRQLVTPHDGALRLLRYYVYRGDTEEWLRSGHMGHWGRDYRASIGGWLNVRYILPSRVIVQEVGGIPCEAIFSLHALYEELERERDGTPAQLCLELPA